MGPSPEFFSSKEESDSCAMTLLLTGERQGLPKTVLNFNAPECDCNFLQLLLLICRSVFYLLMFILSI